MLGSNPAPSSPGGTAALTDLFQPPSTPKDDGATETSKLLQHDDKASSLGDLFQPQPESYSVPIKGDADEEKFIASNRPPIQERCKNMFKATFQPSTIIGSFVFLLYHIVYCMAQASTITRPYSSTSIVGPMAKMAALGIMFASPVFVFLLGDQIPAIYPTSDLFLAPFLANLAVVVDEALYQDGLEQELDVFLATFTAVVSFGILISGLLSILGSVVKLANLGAFLPYSVLCGFFSAIGILMYTLAFSVDTGEKIGHVLLSGDASLIFTCILHHVPSLAIGVIMHVIGPQNPFYVLLLVVATITVSYLLLFISGTSLSQAQQLQWFWTAQDLTDSSSSSLGFDSWAPPAPFGVFHSLVRGKVRWGAFLAGLPTAFALALLYVIRGSLHAAALKKNIPNVTRAQPLDASPVSTKGLQRTVSTDNKKSGNVSLPEILVGYGSSQVMAAFSGGIAVAPAVGAAMTLFQLGAEKPPPQYGSVVLLAFFYLTDFKLVCFIPKAAFSCLLVLSFLDLVRMWFIDSFSKTRNKFEWTVVPIIVFFTFVLGMLNAIFIGVGVSTFIFVASFYRTGVVKFLANGLTMRSIVSRNIRDNDWLDQNGDLIQICVLQGFVFFGNAQSVLSYITTMFEEPDVNSHAELPFPLPPIPKHLVIDFTIVTDVDTSAVDLIREVVTLCRKQRCRLYLTGLNPSIKSTFVHAGIKGGSGVYFVSNLETALGRAEDDLLTKVCHVEEMDELDAGVRRRARALSNADDGFRFALQKIDELHDVQFAQELIELEKYTKVVELQPEETLFRDDEMDRGFFFVEFGILRVQQDTSYAPSVGSSPSFGSDVHFQALQSIGHMNARDEAVAREGALVKSNLASHRNQAHVFRLARIGQGWVVGTIEGLSGMRSAGVCIAVTACRLHLLPYYRVKELEKTRPALILNLLKMISRLGAKRQEKTIEQLSNFFRMLNSPAPRTHGSIDRLKLAAIQRKIT